MGKHQSVCYGKFTKHKFSTWLLAAVVGLMATQTLRAQPGWIDYTARYYYSITDAKGKTISFKKNKAYRIMVDGTLYTSRTIPSDSLPFVTDVRTNKFDNYIRINDFSLRLPQDRQSNRLSIAVIHKKDTMHLFQPTGRGSSNAARIYEKSTPVPPDRTLQFVPGRYYFPNWADLFFKGLPTLSGKAKFVNAQTGNFIIPKTLYDSVAGGYSNRNYRLSEQADSLVADNFMKPWLIMDKKEEHTSIDTAFPGFKHPYIPWPVIKTADADVYACVAWYHETAGLLGGMGVFSHLNRKENTIKHWIPPGDYSSFSTASLHHDPYNKLLYNKTRTYAPDCDLKSLHNCPPTWHMYLSADEGKTWAEDKPLRALHDKYPLRTLEFLDKEHALAYTLETKKNTQGHRYQQGTYFLLRDMQVIDSLQTPTDVHYNSNYSRYEFSRSGDTIALGRWGLDERSVYGSTYSKPSLTKTNGMWKFNVETAVYRKPEPDTAANAATTDFMNFTLRGREHLTLKNGSGTLAFTRHGQRIDEGSGIRVLERGSHIYLLDHSFTLLSFDGGTSWYFYPKPLMESSNPLLMEIDGSYNFSFFESGTGYPKVALRKVTYRFQEKL